jgi:hypothetical protein
VSNHEATLVSNQRRVPHGVDTGILAWHAAHRPIGVVRYAVAARYDIVNERE